MKTCSVHYNKQNNTLTFECKSSELLPAYLHYLLEYHKLPETATIVFNDKSVKLVKIDQNYKFERI